MARPYDCTRNPHSTGSPTCEGGDSPLTSPSPAPRNLRELFPARKISVTKELRIVFHSIKEVFRAIAHNALAARLFIRDRVRLGSLTGRYGSNLTYVDCVPTTPMLRGSVFV